MTERRDAPSAAHRAPRCEKCGGPKPGERLTCSLDECPYTDSMTYGQGLPPAGGWKLDMPEDRSAACNCGGNHSGIVGFEGPGNGHAVTCPVRTAATTAPREAFDTDSVRVGDVIRYPARLRAEHKGSRSNQIVVLRIEDGFLRCAETVDGEKREWSIYPMQLSDNGVLVEDHVGD